MKKVYIIVLPNCIASSVVGLFDILNQTVNMNKELYGGLDGHKGFKVQLVSAIRHTVVYSDSGVPLQCHKQLNFDDNPDIVILPALRDFSHPLENHGLLNWLGKIHIEGTTVCSVCTGAFILAQAGLLENKEATVSWFAVQEFHLRYPEIVLKKENILVDNGNVIMAGASTSFLNLGIYLIEKFFGRTLANYAAKILLVNKGNVSQQSYSIFIGQKNHNDEHITKAQEFIENNINKSISVAEVVTQTSLSKRTFVRKFKKLTGISPLEYIQRIKVEYAKKQLESGNTNISQLSYSTGYDDLNFFRQIFKRYTGLTPSQYQKQFTFV